MNNDSAILARAETHAFQGVLAEIQQLGELASVDFNAIDPIALFLDSCNNDNTRRAYKHSLAMFFGNAGVDEVRAFLRLPNHQLSIVFQAHRNQMVRADAAPASINRRLAALKSLLKFCHRKGWSQSDGRNLIDSEKTIGYRDTRGLDFDAAKKLLKAPIVRHGDTPRGWRDTALIYLFLVHGLRCEEVQKTDVGDFNLMDRRLRITGKGRNRQSQWISLSKQTALAIETYLTVAGHKNEAGEPLFRNFDRNTKVKGKRITLSGVAKVLDSYKDVVGVTKISPHQLRHSAISNLLLETEGNMFMVQKFSRHIDPKVIDRYWDNLRDLQIDAANLLENLFSGKKKRKKFD